MKSSLRVYYAHPVSEYNTKTERHDVAMLSSLGLTVVNPNEPHHIAAYEREGMGYFKHLVPTCDALAFRAFPRGNIGAGVATEIDTALQFDMAVIELPEFPAIWSRVLSVGATRNRVRLELATA